MNALNCLFEGFKWLNKKGLGPYIWIPLAVNTLLFLTAGIVLYHYFSTWLDQLLPKDSWLSYFSYILWPLFGLMIILMFLYGFSLLANIIAAPFNAYLSEKVEKIETGSCSQNDRNLAQDIWITITEEIKKTLFFILWAIPIIVIGFIPVLNIVAPLLWFLYTAWSLYIQYMDYPMANDGYLFAQERKILVKQPVDMCLFGGFVSLAMMIPLLNLFMMPVAVIAATLHWCRNVRFTVH